MPRQARQASETGIYHVMMRGINHQNIFEEQEDYYQFLNTLDLMAQSYESDGTPAERVSKLLWCRIWDKKIFINFNEDQYVAHYPNDIRFGIM